jgi:hypothetical protein
MLRRSHVVFYSKVALLAIGVGIVVGVALFSGSLGNGENSMGTTTTPTQTWTTTTPPTQTGATSTPTSLPLIAPEPGEYLPGGENKILLIDSSVGYSTIDFDSPPYGAHVGDPGIVVGGIIKNEYDRDYWISVGAVAFGSEGEEIGHSIDLGPFVGIVALHVGSGQTGGFGFHLKYSEDIERIELYVGSVSEIPPP